MIASNDNNGIWLEYCTSNEIASNTVLNNSKGVSLAWSGYSILRDNNMTGNAYNFGVEGDYLSDFILDVDASNTVNGKPVYYLINKRNLVINPLTFPNAGYLAIVNCTNITVKDLNLTNNWNGILLVYTSNSKIENVNVSNNWDGIHLSNCVENAIRENTITSDNDGILLHSSANNEITRNTLISCGIYLVSSNNNQIKNNTVSKSIWGAAITLEDSSRYNTLSENTMSNNLVGVALGYNEPHDNEIYHNNFIDNLNQVFGLVTLWWQMNKWDNSMGEGNYWSDYRGEDLNGDGIGDTHLPHLRVDYYPLMTKYWNMGDVNHDGKVNIFDIYIIAKAFGSRLGDKKWNAMADVNKDGKVDILDVYLIVKSWGKTA